MRTTNIQIRSVPTELRERVKRRARTQGRSMSEYLLTLIEREMRIPTAEEFRRRLERIKPVRLDRSAAADIKELRGERDNRLDRSAPSKRRRRV